MIFTTKNRHLRPMRHDQPIGVSGGSALSVGASPHPILLNPYGVEPQQIKLCKSDIKQRRGLPLWKGDNNIAPIWANNNDWHALYFIYYLCPH